MNRKCWLKKAILDVHYKKYPITEYSRRLIFVRNTGMYLWPNIKRKILAFGHKEKRKINLGKEKTTSVRDAIHSPFWIYSIEMPLLGYFQHFIGESATDHCTLLNPKIERVIKSCYNNWDKVLTIDKIYQLWSWLWSEWIDE